MLIRSARLSALVVLGLATAGCFGARIDTSSIDGTVVGFAISDPDTAEDKQSNLYAIRSDGMLELVEGAPKVNRIGAVGAGVYFQADESLWLLEPGEAAAVRAPFENATCASAVLSDGTVVANDGSTWTPATGATGSIGFDSVMRVEGRIATVTSNTGGSAVLDLESSVRYNVAACNGPYAVPLSNEKVMVDDCDPSWLLDMTDGSRSEPDSAPNPPLNGQAEPAPWGGAVAVSQTCGTGGAYNLCHVDEAGAITTLGSAEISLASAGGWSCAPPKTVFTTPEANVIVVAEQDQVRIFDRNGAEQQVAASGFNITRATVADGMVWVIGTRNTGDFTMASWDLVNDTSGSGLGVPEGVVPVDIAMFGTSDGIYDSGPGEDEVTLAVTVESDPDCITLPQADDGTPNVKAELYAGADTSGTLLDSGSGGSVSFNLTKEAGEVTLFAFSDLDDDGVPGTYEPSAEATYTVASANLDETLTLLGCGGTSSASTPVALSVGASFTGTALSNSTSYLLLTPETTDVHTISLYGFDTDATSMEWRLFAADGFNQSTPLMMCELAGQGHLFDDVCNTPELTAGTDYLVAVLATDFSGGANTEQSFSLLATEGENSHPFMGSEAEPTMLELGVPRSLIMLGGQGDVAVTARSGYAYGIYVTNASDPMLLTTGYLTDTFIFTGEGEVEAPDNDDRFATVVYKGAGEIELHARLLGSSDLAEEFDIELREGQLGGQVKGSGPDIALDTPTQVGAAFNDRYFTFTPAGSSATFDLLDTTAGATIKVYDPSDALVGEVSATSDAEFSQQLVIGSGLTAGEEHVFEIVGSDLERRNVVGTLSIHSP